MSSGQLKADANGNFIGNVSTLTLDMDIKLQIIPLNERRENGPVFNVLAIGRTGKAVKVGAAWEKRTKDDQPFYSMTLDDPSWTKPLNLTAFAAKEPGVFDLTFDRPRQKSAAA